MVQWQRASVAVLLLAPLMAIVPTGASIDDCGPEQPASGLYLHTGTMRLYSYDCFTGAIVPTTGEAGDSLCVREVDPTTNQIVPIAGSCALVEALSETTYRATFFFAVLGYYNNGFGSLHDHEGGPHAVACPNEASACRPASNGVGGLPAEIGIAGLGVSYLKTVIEGDVDCSEGPAYLGAHFEAWGYAGLHSTRHHAMAALCSA